MKLEESKSLKEVWNVRRLRESLQRYICIHENARKHEANTRSSSNRNMKGDDCFGPRQFTDKRNQRLVKGILITNSKKKVVSNKVSRPSLHFFCKGSHFMITDKYTTLGDRKQLSLQASRNFPKNLPIILLSVPIALALYSKVANNS